MAWAGAVIGVVGALAQGSQSAQAGKYNAAQGWQNAQIERQSGIDQATQQARENYMRLGDMKATGGASGSTGGSFLDVLGDSAAQMELARQNVLYTSAVKQNLLARGASVAEAGAVNATTNSYLKAGSELLRSGSALRLSRAGGGNSGAGETFGMTGNE